MSEQQETTPMAVDEIDVLGDGGILKQIIRPGKEDETMTPFEGCEVTVHYVGTLASNGKKFDSSRDRNDPFKFKLGVGQVIKGWDEGVATMKRGEIAMFTLKPEYAYGANGSPPTIPPNATLKFEVELIDFTDEEEISNGITKKTLRVGEGYRSAAEDGAILTCKYIKIWPEGKEDQVVENLENFTFIYGDELLVNHVEEAIGSLKLKEKALFTLRKFNPVNLQYTKHSEGFKNFYTNECLTNSNLTLKMEVELDAIDNEKNNWEMTPEEKLTLAEKKKENGNEFFKAGRTALAKKRYDRVLQILDSEPEEEEEKKKYKQLVAAASSNLAAIYIKENDLKKAIEQCDKTLEVDPQNIKAYYRKASALQGLAENVSAKVVLEECLKVVGEPQDENQKQQIQAVNVLLNKVNKAVLEETKREKQMFSKMFK
ncbi:hypothetical protein ABK040_012235 [Willaertia magna]